MFKEGEVLNLNLIRFGGANLVVMSIRWEELSHNEILSRGI